MNWYKEYKTAGIERPLHILGLELDVEVSGKHWPGSYEDPPEYPLGEIVGASILDTKEFIESYPDIVGVHELFSEKVNTELQNQQRHFGKTTQFIVIFNGVKFIIKTPTGSSDNIEIIDANIVDESELIESLSESVDESVQNIARE